MVDHFNLPSLAPRTFQDAMEFSKLLAESNFVPKDFKGKPGDILAAIQMGYEIGLAPMAALQNIAVINGRPCIWGDAALAVIKNSGLLVHFNEYWEGDGTAVCEVGRKGHLDVDGKQHITIGKFGRKEAQAAGLLGKQTYQQYQGRMFQMRARGFPLRDEFPDVLKGLITREEAMDYPPQPSKVEVVDLTNDLELPTEGRLKDYPLYLNRLKEQLERLDIKSPRHAREYCKEHYGWPAGAKPEDLPMKDLPAIAAGFGMEINLP